MMKTNGISPDELKQKIFIHLKETKIKHTIKELANDFNKNQSLIARLCKQLGGEGLISLLEETGKRTGKVTTKYKIKYYFVK